MAHYANTTTVPSLFSAVTLGGKEDPVQLKHRVALAPLTRVRTGDAGTPTDLVVQYYEQRATDGGLLITEATNISPTARGYFGAPGIFNQNQIESWKPVTKAVHDKGGKIFMQLWHTGRVGHPLNQPNDQLPVFSSATSFVNAKSRSVTREGRKDYVTPRALDISELPGVVADYKRAAENAIAAGFDGVEVHAANGYLLEQFLCDRVNSRKDKYGGSIENRARLLFEVLEAVLSSLPSSKVGIRLSPFGETFGCSDSNPRETYGYVVNKLNGYDLAYLSVIERRGMHTDKLDAPEGGIARHFRSVYNGVLITAAGFDRTEAMQTVEDGRLRADAKLTPYDRKTFYLQPDMPLEAGYTDYPFLGEEDKGARSSGFVWEA
ncbi:12-oxophytodienoate reductase, putative [Phytophthora infestans T30-4]|uniref:12-oxophytodienoate reductase, putative n=1 Tax=Phytophthora infestans (strain T30-4) TaxID=403677 RepID=D0NF18_PHYIT|nr:12-oxophytodienoate reductase, putative [Phytophthora infestans T30-4]EEY56807.1 12-oxophytodienoate reductase, putative [Phytophthora infestans T30-4]|eukprot:XP_002902135.1 12-oxophytodienoate reductase, putative [Phytophthora infestans T30-4]